MGDKGDDTDRNTGPERRNRRRGAMVALAVLMGGAVTAACSSGSASPSVASLSGHGGSTQPSGGPLTVAQSDQGMLDFTRCMRSHGVQMSDPFHRQGHQGLSIDMPTQSAANADAYRACNHFMTPLNAQKQAGARQELAAWLPPLTHYAQCMRSHDIGMLDPDAQGSLALGDVPGITSHYGRQSPQFRAADAACRHLLPAAVHDDGTGP